MAFIYRLYNKCSMMIIQLFEMNHQVSDLFFVFTDDLWPRWHNCSLPLFGGDPLYVILPGRDSDRLEPQLPGEVIAQAASELSPSMEISQHQAGCVHLSGHCGSCHYIPQFYEKFYHQPRDMQNDCCDHCHPSVLLAPE